MKKYSLITAICVVGLFVIGLLTHGCSKDYLEIPDLDIPKEFSEVGKLHNEGLEYAWVQLKEQAIESVNNPTKKRLSADGNNINEFVKKTTLDFCRQNKKLQNELDFIEPMLEDFFTPKRSLKSEIAQEITPDLKMLLDEIQAVLGKEYPKDNFSRLKAQLDVINRKATAKLSERDAAVVFCATSTGYYSYQYWYENHSKWFFALNFPEIFEMFGNDDLNKLKIKQGKIVRKGFWDELWNTAESWYGALKNEVTNWWEHGGRDVATQDAAGAAAGALACALFSSWSGPGSIGGAISGAIVAGIGCSTHEAIVQWLNSL